MVQSKYDARIEGEELIFVEEKRMPITEAEEDLKSLDHFIKTAEEMVYKRQEHLKDIKEGTKYFNEVEIDIKGFEKERDDLKARYEVISKVLSTNKTQDVQKSE